MIHKGAPTKKIIQCINTEGTKELSLGKSYNVLANASSAGIPYVTIVSDRGNRYAYKASRFIIKPSITLKKDFI
jgi:hypothetical protein